MLQPRHIYGAWTLCDEPATRIVASNRHKRQHPYVKPPARLPARVTYQRPTTERKAGLFKRAAQSIRRVFGA